MRHLNDVVNESMFDPDLIKKDPSILKLLKNKKDLFEKVSRWENRNLKTNVVYEIQNLWLPDYANGYICILFGFILSWNGPVIKSKPNFDSDLKKTSIILYLSRYYNMSIIDVIELLKNTGNIQYIKYKDLFTIPNLQLCSDQELQKIVKNLK